MLALGIIFIVLSGAFLVAALAGGADDQAAFTAGNLDITMSTMAAFLLGAGTLLVFVIGLELVRSGFGRARRHRKQTKELNRLSKRVDDRDEGQRRAAADHEE